MVAKSITFTTLKCSACSRSFSLVLHGQKQIECSHCKRQYVLVRSEWHDKVFADHMRKKRKQART